MRCRNCQEESHHIQTIFCEGRLIDICDKCGGLKNYALPDVSDVKEPYIDSNLRDKEHPKGYEIHSRGHKAEILKKLGLREVRESTIKYYKDPEKRRKYCTDQWGGNG